MTSQDIIKLLDYTDARIMSAMFNDIIREKTQFRIDTQKLWEEYDGDVEIKKRTRPVGVPDYKANNKIPNDFFSMIIDQGITYTFGKPIVTELGEAPEKTLKAFKDFKNRNNLDDLDLETALYTAVCGTSGRLCYIDKQGFERVTALAPWEVAYVYNRTNGEMEYAMVYYQMEVTDFSKQGKQKSKVWFIEWYDRTEVRFYIEKTNEQGVFKLDEANEKPIMQHGFAEVPVIEVINNDARKGDFVRVRELKNAYDRLVSDAQNELEDFRSAYMKFKGIIPDPQTMEMAKQTGAFGSEDEDFDVDFLIKELNGEYLENHKRTLVDNIFKFSKRVDMNDEKFSGATQSGENRKWKMLALENDAGMKERKFTKSLRQMYSILSSSWQRKSIQIDPLEITFQFTRNLPVDLGYYGEIISNLFGKIPLETLYSLMPFIDDVQVEIKNYEARYGSSLIDLGQIDEPIDN